MRRPRILDLFCGAGGAAMGYHRAGFDVVGVDINPQPRYPFEFHQADALIYPLDGFDAIHASPPCQAYAGVTAWRGSREDHPALIAQTRERLLAAGVPWVIENVPDARRELRSPVMLCGTMFGSPFRRHRFFEFSQHPAVLQQPCRHRSSDFSFDHGGKQPESVYRDAIGVEWMTVQESREAIPPVFTAHIGGLLLDQLESVEAS